MAMLCPGDTFGIVLILLGPPLHPTAFCIRYIDVHACDNVAYKHHKVGAADRCKLRQGGHKHHRCKREVPNCTPIY